MVRSRLLAAAGFSAAIWLSCAGDGGVSFGGDGGSSGDGGAAGSTATTSTTTSTTTSSTTTSSTSTSSTTTSSTTTSSTGTGGEGGAPGCEAPEHWCGAVCAANTPATGCYQSFTCFPCPTPNHGAPACTPSGQCTVSCTAPWVPQGNLCVCPSQCCQAQDCPPPQSCSNGQCTGGGACDPLTCLLQCFQNGFMQGTCDPQNNCVCS